MINHIKNLEFNGFSVMKIDDLNSLKLSKKFIKEMDIAKGKDDLSSFYPVNNSDKLKNILNFNFKKLYLSYKLKKFSKINNFKNISDNYFKEDSILTKIDSYISYPKDENIINWHTDMASPQTKKNSTEIIPIDPKRGLLKFILYLTESVADDISFAVIPESHKVSTAYKEMIFNKKLYYQSHWSISDFKKIIQNKEIRNKLNENLETNVLEKFIHNIDFDEKKDTTMFDIPLNFMNVIMFDEHTYHRAKSPKKSRRFIYRFCYGRKRIYKN